MSEVSIGLLLLGSSEGKFVLGKSLSEGSGLLLSQIVRSVLALCEGFSGSSDSLLVDHCKDLSDGLSGVLLKLSIVKILTVI